MSTFKNSCITPTDLGLNWPGGQQALSGVTGTGRVDLVGANGSGESSLLRLIAGELSPTSDRIPGSR